MSLTYVKFDFTSGKDIYLFMMIWTDRPAFSWWSLDPRFSVIQPKPLWT